jgi:hypothetical protein
VSQVEPVPLEDAFLLVAVKGGVIEDFPAYIADVGQQTC